jgi:hypothetical protein
MKFNLEDYEPVDARIKRFYAEHPEGRITTELLSNPDAIDTAVVKAFLYVGDELKATGLAFEKAGDGMANKTSHLENCETSAIGRALANWNYSGNKRPSREEMQKAAQPDIGEARAKTLAMLEASGLSDTTVSDFKAQLAEADSIAAVRSLYTNIQKQAKEAEVVY